MGEHMPPPLLFDLDRIDTHTVEYDRDSIYQRMPYEDEFQLLDGVFFVDRQERTAAAYHDCRADAWWTRGHIPGRPVFPGALQIELAGQLVAFMSRYVEGDASFIGFGGVEDCRFREAVTPPARLILIARLVEERSRRVKGDVQGLVSGKIVFHLRVTGLAMPTPT